jgi:NADPH-dependent 2,4-dienoyl-CoA reductase/sulfur reductase-like enzyme
VSIVDAALAYATEHPALSHDVALARARLDDHPLAALAVPFVREHLAAPAALRALADRSASTWLALARAPAAYDVVVIGGGVVAAAVARRLAARGRARSSSMSARGAVLSPAWARRFA